MADLAGGVGSLIGNLFGSSNVNDAIQGGVNSVNQMTQLGAIQLAPYNEVGASYLGPVAQNLLGDSTASSNIGNTRINSPNAYNPNTFSNPDPVNFENFASTYNQSEGAKYLMNSAQQAQDSSASAKGGMLTGANLRAQTGIAEGISNQDLMDHYKAMAAGQKQGFDEYQQGQQQDFAQRETSYQNLYGQEAMGLQAATAEAGTLAQGARALGSLASTQATAAQAQSAGFGSALGSIFTGITNLPFVKTLFG
jgi:hypothetical protein